jgi:hypothetical protein
MNKLITIIAPLKNAKIILFSLILLYCSASCAAQTGDSIKNIPSNIKQASQQKAVGKSNSVTKDALNLADSTSNKVFRSMKGMFKKKPHPPTPPAAAPKDSTSPHSGATSMIVLPLHTVITLTGSKGSFTMTGNNYSSKPNT